jgi:hypothetical protein
LKVHATTGILPVNGKIQKRFFFVDGCAAVARPSGVPGLDGHLAVQNPNENIELTGVAMSPPGKSLNLLTGLLAKRPARL